MYRFFFVFILLAMTPGCQKNELTIMSDFDCSDKNVKDRDGAPLVQVTDSTLVSQSIDNYDQIRE
jgi:hypothetical protein